MPNLSFAECYSILNTDSTKNMELVRKSYKLQIQKWHPDRFPENSSDKITAEEKIKTLNAAYKILSEYHKKNGVLPGKSADEQSVNLPPKPRKKAWQKDSSLNSKNTNNAGSNKKEKSEDTHQNYKPYSQPHSSSSSISQFLKLSVFIAIIIGISYTIILSFAPRNIGEHIEKQTFNAQPSLIISQPHQPSPALIFDKKKINDSSSNKNKDSFFTIGSSIGKVIMVQGKPTRIIGDTWYYGESVVYFDKGNVKEWVRHSSYPLKARIVDNTKFQPQSLNHTEKSKKKSHQYPQKTTTH